MDAAFPQVGARQTWVCAWLRAGGVVVSGSAGGARVAGKPPYRGNHLAGDYHDRMPPGHRFRPQGDSSMMVWWSLPWRGQARRHDAWWRRQHWPVVAEYLPPGTERPLTGWGQFRHGGNQASSWSRTPPVTSSCRRRPCLAHPCPHEVSGPTYYLSATVPAPRSGWRGCSPSTAATAIQGVRRWP